MATLSGKFGLALLQVTLPAHVLGVLLPVFVWANEGLGFVNEFLQLALFVS